MARPKKSISQNKSQQADRDSCNAYYARNRERILADKKRKHFPKENPINKKATEQEIQFLSQNYKFLSVKECAKILNTTERRISNIIYKYNLKKNPSPAQWTDEEKKYIKQNYNILGGRFIAERLGKKASSLRTYAFKNGLKFNIDANGNKIRKEEVIHLKKKEDITYLLELNDPFFVYFLGLCWADGHLRKKRNELQLSIVRPDFNCIKDKVFSMVKRFGFHEYHDGQSNHNIVCHFSINNNLLWSFLKDNDYLIKSGASADKILSQIPKPFQHYWWRGYFHGDGSFSFNKNSKSKFLGIVSCINQDWNFFKNLAKELNLSYGLNKTIKPDGNSSRIYIQNKDSIIKFSNYIYQGERFGIHRKQDKYEEYIKYLELK